MFKYIYIISSWTSSKIITFSYFFLFFNILLIQKIIEENWELLAFVDDRIVGITKGLVNYNK